MSVTELENRIVKMQEWEQLAQDAAAEAEATITCSISTNATV